MVDFAFRFESSRFVKISKTEVFVVYVATVPETNVSPPRSLPLGHLPHVEFLGPL